MAFIIDIVLVSVVVGLSLLAVVKYFVELGNTTEKHTIACSGCNAGCPDLPNYDKLITQKIDLFDTHRK